MSLLFIIKTICRKSVYNHSVYFLVAKSMTFVFLNKVMKVMEISALPKLIKKEAEGVKEVEVEVVEVVEEVKTKVEEVVKITIGIVALMILIIPEEEKVHL